jgi:FixJ family two-component response regulator
MTSAQPVVHVVDDDASFRKATGRMLQTSGYRVVLYDSGKKLLEGLPLSEEPNCILLDLKMAGLDGLKLQERLANLGSVSPIVFLSGHGDIPATVHAMKSGADNFLTKPVPKAALIDAIERALVRFTQEREQRDRLESLKQLVSRLTPRESEVFALIIRGRLNKLIGHSLNTTERTIKAHRRSIMQKLEVHSLAEAVSIAERLGMLQTPDEKLPST